MRLYVLLLLLTTAPPKYHLTLLAHPAAPFPFLSKFGSVTIDVYPEGVRAETFWLNGFSRNGAPAVTVMNPVWRMYTDVPISEIAAILRKLSTAGMESAAPYAVQKPVGGTVKGIAAVRYRMQYGPEAWIDLWTTRAVPENPQLRAIVAELVSGISPATASTLRAIPGTPLYVELNFRRYRKLPLLECERLRFDDAGAGEALKVGAVYFRAPLLDAIWK